MPDRSTRAGDGFAELVLAEPEWVRAEFDAIVAANFRGRPHHRFPLPAAVRGCPDRSRAGRAGARCPAARREVPAAGARSSAAADAKRTEIEERGVMP
ncbi:hypothetical protein [Amycolatopsis mediterranei]|uniref:hypothetical protein n=1 Tax=Amycolatopsis mediterranei TaxID=33910 RepID=UPI0013E8DA25|nr:hypothetical protein [Amycolatopsis mediterranei]